MFGLGFGEVLVVLVIALIFIPPRKLPELARSLGQGLKELQKASKAFTDQIAQEADSIKQDVKKDIETEIKPELVHDEDHSGVVPHERGPEFVVHPDDEIDSAQDENQPKKPV